ncbi:MAG: right-handed parallel beta-helix repeat-containing protein [Pseudomonadota bacterium]
MGFKHILLAFGIALPLLPGAAAGDVLHAAYGNAEPAFERDAECGEGGGFVGYVGTERVCADIVIDELREAEGLLDGIVDQVVLLTSRPLEKTLYRATAGREPIMPLEYLARPLDRPLTIRGQRASDGTHLVWLKGLDLVDTVCDPRRVNDLEACRNGLPSEADEEVPWARRYEMTSLGLVEDARSARIREAYRRDHEGVTAFGPRAYCTVLRWVRGITLQDIGYEDCWITAIGAVNSQHVTVRGARIHGSTFGMFALATEGLSPASHSFVVSNSHWIQSPGAYREGTEPCDRPHQDLTCALDVWDDIPWGVAHHHLWRPLNGALFAALDIAGNVLIENNTLERAYNGVRIISELPGTGRNVEVRGNTFRFMRDNAVEPETQAYGWVVKHNRFENVHAWLSTDGVKGSGFYIFGNTATYDPDNMPGTGCSDDIAWERSPRFEAMAGDDGRYVVLDVSYDPTSVDCRGHYRGTVLKTGDKRKSKFPYLDRISIFNNTWRTRSPLFSSKHASPLSHFNNLIAFTGCGLDGPWDCKQIPVPAQYCGEGNKRTRGRVAMAQYWTDDGEALVADCVSMVPGPAQPDDRAAFTADVSHVFCRDLFNRSFAGLPYGEDRCAPVFEPEAIETAAREVPRLLAPMAGCRVRVTPGAVLPDCAAFGPQVGAVQPGGWLYDIEIEGAGYLGRNFVP